MNTETFPYYQTIPCAPQRSYNTEWPYKQTQMILRLRDVISPSRSCPDGEVQMLSKDRQYHGSWDDASLPQALVSLLSGHGRGPPLALLTLSKTDLELIYGRNIFQYGGRNWTDTTCIKIYEVSFSGLAAFHTWLNRTRRTIPSRGIWEI